MIDPQARTCDASQLLLKVGIVVADAGSDTVDDSVECPLAVAPHAILSFDEFAECGEDTAVQVRQRAADHSRIVEEFSRAGFGEAVLSSL